MSENKALPRVLCVDDEPNILSALRRSLYGEFEVLTAGGGEAGLVALGEGAPFEVVVSDMRMPGMDGATFLAQVRERSPDSVRILLTGQADLPSSIAAVNKGAIFRYLCKPCPNEVLIETIHEAVTQHRLVGAEKRLLETTLSATVKTLSEVLAMVAPWAFQRASFVQSCVRHALPLLRWPNSWIYSVAAALSQIGCVSIPPATAQEVAARRRLSPGEHEMLDDHPEIAYRLIAAIPRLETVALIVRHQYRPAPPDASVEVQLGSHLLRAALALERASGSAQRSQSPREVLAGCTPSVPPAIVAALAEFRAGGAEVRSVRIRDLQPGWLVDEDIRCTNGMMVLSKGHELTDTAITALARLLAAHALQEPVRVRCGRD